MIELIDIDNLICSIIISLMTFSCIFLYNFLTRNKNYWSKQGIQGPKPVFLFGNFLDRFKNSLALIDEQYMNEYGDVYGLFNGTAPVLQVADPNLIKQVLVKDFSRFRNRRELKTEDPVLSKLLFFSRSDIWKRIRTISSPTFSRTKVKNMFVLMRHCIGKYITYLEEIASNGQPISIKELHENSTLDVLASIVFGTETDAFNDKNNEFFTNCRIAADFKPIRLIPAIIFPKFLNKLFNIRSFIDPKAADWLIGYSKHIIRKRQHSDQKINDFLQLLIDAKVKENVTGGSGSSYIKGDAKSQQKATIVNKFLTEEEIIATSCMFLLAGFETTAATLGYFSYEMALNQDCQERLHNELARSMGPDNEISHDELQRLPYLEACISETLRLYPPLIRIEREVNEDFELGTDPRIQLLKGQLVEIPVYAIHRSEKYFKDAKLFIPDRFLPESANQITPYTYMPFGIGPRNCIGKNFALMELKLAMAHIIFRYRFIKCDQTEEKIRFKIMTPMLSPYSLTVGIEKR